MPSFEPTLQINGYELPINFVSALHQKIDLERMLYMTRVFKALDWLLN